MTGNDFDGTWYMDRAGSRYWDYASSRWIPEPILAQTVSMRTEGDTMHYKIAIKHGEELTTHMEYTCRFDDPEWVPYTCVAMESPHGVTRKEGGGVLKSGLELGKPLAFIKQIYVDERTQYRITKNPDGTAQYVMLRRLSEDGSTNTGVCMDPNGHTFVEKVFTRNRPADAVDVLEA